MLKYFQSAATMALLLCIGYCSLQAQKHRIHNFEVVEGKVLFDATHVSPAEDSTNPGPPENAFALGLPGETPIAIEGRVVGDTLKFSAPVPAGVFPGMQAFLLFFESDTLFEKVVTVPNSLFKTGTQPMIETLYPRGTSPGRVVTLKGKGFGDNLDNIYIWFSTEEDNPLPARLSEVLNPLPATYLTTKDADGFQELKFMVPGSNRMGDRLEINSETWLEYDLRMRVVVKGQPSANSETLSVVRQDYRLKLFLMVMAVFVAFLVFVWGLYSYMHRKGYAGKLNLKALVIDTATQQYSLAKVQALAWTLVLLLSYMYYVLITFVILDRATIPDFDSSLLILMGITTGGMLIARSTDRTKQQKAGKEGAALVNENGPSLWDLISENGVINLASLQLVLFTVVSIGVYILFMTDTNLVETGMPTMPPTLLGLMGISQGGYLTGKVVETPGAESQAYANPRDTSATESPEVK